MKCCHFQEMMSERLDQVLASAETVEFDTHAAECASCQQVWQEFTQSWELLATLPELEPSHLFQAQVWDKLRQDPPRQPVASLWRRIRQWVTGGLVTASALALVLQLGNSVANRPTQKAPVLATLEMPRMGAYDWDPSVELLTEVDYLAEESTAWEATPLPLGQMSHDYLAQAESALDETLEEN